MEMAKKLGIAAAFVAVALTGCAAPSQPLGSAPDSFEQAVGETADEIELHRASLSVAHTMDDVRLEAARHASAVEIKFDELRAYLGTLDGCRDGAVRVYLWSMMNGLEATERGHLVELQHAGGLDDARRDADLYADGLGELLARMSSGWDRSSCAP